MNGVRTYVSLGLYKAQVLQVAGHIGVVTEGTILLIITQVSSG